MLERGACEIIRGAARLRLCAHPLSDLFQPVSAPVAPLRPIPNVYDPVCVKIKQRADALRAGLCERTLTVTIETYLLFSLGTLLRFTCIKQCDYAKSS